MILQRQAFRDRTRGVPDKILGAHGHAAFADYVWLRSYTCRLPAKGHTEKSVSYTHLTLPTILRV